MLDPKILFVSKTYFTWFLTACVEQATQIVLHVQKYIEIFKNFIMGHAILHKLKGSMQDTILYNVL